MGIITQFNLQNEPVFKLKEEIRALDKLHLFDNLDMWKHQYRHLEFFVFPYSDTVLLKTLSDTQGDMYSSPQPFISDDILLKTCSEIVRAIPAAVNVIHQLVGIVSNNTQRIDYSRNIYPSARNVRFNEMEYQVPADKGVACLEEVIHCIKKEKMTLFWPIEFRFVKGDDNWISPFYQRDSASISIHEYHKTPYKKTFAKLEKIMRRYEGRPHWGKLHTLTGKELCKLYPKWEDFNAIRRELDPHDKWLNNHLNTIFTL